METSKVVPTHHVRLSEDLDILPMKGLSSKEWLRRRHTLMNEYPVEYSQNMLSDYMGDVKTGSARSYEMANVDPAPQLPMLEDLIIGGTSLLKHDKLSDALEHKAREQRHLAMTHFIQEYIRRKECVHFVPKKDPKRKPDDPVVCHCGDIAENHVKGADGVREFFQARATTGLQLLNSGADPNKFSEADLGSNAEWKAASDIQEFKTNAYGKIAFINEGLGGHKPCKFIRLADNTPTELTIDLLVDHWRIMQPSPAHLVISVIGGAKNFKLDGKKKEVFNRGLVNAAQTTSAWILTSGFNMGVMKAVGEAVAEGQSYNWDKLGMTHSLRCIGIAPWGYVERREALVSKDKLGSWNATYRINNVIRHGHPVSLNPDHTHFLMVDDGNRNRYGGVADFRAKLERKISLPIESETGGETGLGIPVVLVVVEGGYDAILDVRKSLKEHIPVVLCEGTGRAADIIAYAFSNTTTTRHDGRMMKEIHKRVLEDKLRTAFGKTWASRSDEQKETEKFLNIVIECCQDDKLITVFDMNKHEDLDLAILSALLKAQGASNLTQLYDQLKLALTWNRSDVAEDKIFNNQIAWPPGYLDDIMTQALIENKVNFIRLLLQNGDVVMHEYLTVPRLRKLYNAAPKMSHLRMLLNRRTRYPIFLLQDVDKLLRKLMSKHIDEHYNNDNDVRAVMLDEEAYTGPSDQLQFPKPFRELFVWAVLMNRKDLAVFLWERCDEAIPGAIAASRIYNSLANLVAQYDSDLLLSYKNKKIEFEELAIKVLDECQNTDPEKAAMLVRRKCHTWGDVNCLEMAAAADDKAFLSTVCCQNILDIMWKKGVSANSFKTIMSILFCPLIFGLVRFHKLDDHKKERTLFQKVHDFYSAPSVKFTSNVMMYLVFLLLYSYMILFEFRPQMRPLEMVVLLWMATFLMEELRMMFFDSSADRLLDRIHDWWRFSFFNRVDMAVILVGIVAVILRLLPDHFILAKTFYAINCVLIFVRLLRDYTASSYLGPKLVMITKMMKELGLYIMIIAIFLLAYGIAIHAVMFPIRDFYILILRDILYYPFWQISGELYLEEIEGTSSDCQPINGTRYKPNGEICPEYNMLVPFLTACYLLMANVLLLNLLIAIFTHVFEEVETNSIQIWKYGMYFLVVAYDNKPCLAPPFIVFNHIYLLMKWLSRRTCCVKHVEEHQYAERQLQLLEVFEKEMTRAYIRQRYKKESIESSDKTVVKIMHGVNEVTKYLEDEKLLREKEEERLVEQNLALKVHKREYSSVSSCASTNILDAECKSTTPTIGRYSRWPSLDKLRQLRLLGSIKEDQTSDGGGTIFQGYGSETGVESTTDFASEYNIRARLPSDSERDDVKKQNIVMPASEPGVTAGALTEAGRARPVTAPPRPPSSSASEQLAGQEPLPRALRRRKSKKKRRQFLEEADTSDVDSGVRQAARRPSWRRGSSSEEENEDTARARREQVAAPVADVRQVELMAESNAAFAERLQCMEEKLGQLESTTSRSLNSIETMLRNSIFNRSMSATPATPPVVETANYAADLFNSRGGLRNRTTLETPPYRRNLQFPPP